MKLLAFVAAALLAATTANALPPIGLAPAPATASLNMYNFNIQS
jgi:hypothetical protein